MYGESDHQKRAIMNASTSNRPSQQRSPKRGVNACALVAICLLVSTAMLFYGPLFFFIFDR
jgi:hypothetical protein